VHLKSSEVSHLRVADDITDLVGGTPMLRLKRLAPAGSADIFAKLEYLNPGGSVKDRAAIGIIRRAEREGKLAPGGTIVEATAARAATSTEQTLGVIESDARTARRFAEIERMLGATPPGIR